MRCIFNYTHFFDKGKPHLFKVFQKLLQSFLVYSIIKGVDRFFLSPAVFQHSSPVASHTSAFFSKLNILPAALLKTRFLLYAYTLSSLLITIILTLPVSAQPNNYPLVRTPKSVAVNRTLPKDILSDDEQITATFSKDPTDEEIFRAHFFAEPLVPGDGKVSSQENTNLVYALASFSQRKSTDDFTAIANFLKNYPESRWQGALLANLGIIYRRTGYYNKAMDAWEKAWALMKNQTDRRVKILADGVVSQLLLLNAWVGRVERIETLLKEIDQRLIEGSAVERISSIRSAVWTMKNNVDIAFKCGPYALNNIFLVKDSTKKFNEKLQNVRSPKEGFSLAGLERIAHDIKLDYQMAFRKPGAEIILNSVVHWKLGHYSALLKKESGHYKCEDATMGTVYGQQFWLTPTALDSSASGYFLVPAGPLPQGWRKVMYDEGAHIFGKGVEPPDQGKHTSDCDEQTGCKSCAGMAQSNVHLASISLHIADMPIFYTPSRGPSMRWDVSYHQRESFQPDNFNYSNFGVKWTFEWLSYVQDDPSNSSANVDVYLMGGGVRTFTGFSTDTISFPELQTNDRLVKICPTCYELRHSDGSKEVYSRPDGNTATGRKIFLTAIVDVAGNKITVSYDGSLRIKALTDGIGQVTTIKYGNATDIYKITRVTDPFGRSAFFDYDNTGKLSKITDMIGLASSFQYDADDFINQMTTPYGITRFVKGEGPGSFRSLETTYPLGEKERAEFAEAPPGIPFSESITPTGLGLFNLYLNYRTTFFWDKKAMQDGPGDYKKARIYHWLHGGSSAPFTIGAPILESIKSPLENRVWYNYQGQSHPAGANQGMSASPSIIGRVLDDGTTQLTKFGYNELGADTVSIDPLGRKLSYLYDTNQIDLLEVRQTTKGANELLAKFTYNNKHLPLTTKDASGQTTKFTYNTSGQLLTVTNPKKETTTLTYDANGYLQNITGPVAGSKLSFTYDGFGRVRTITDPEGYTITTDYDNLDRPTVITYPDNSFEQIVYDRLDAVHTKDRLGKWSHTIYDSLQRPNVIQDALGRITQFIWCSCGSLAEIVDPLKQITTFTRDLQGRVTSKIYDDGKTITYKYDSTTSRLKEVTDAKGQTTKYSYYIDDNLKQINYANATIATPSVSFTYDSSDSRIKTMKDGTGTTKYVYNPVKPKLGSGSLATIDGPLSNDVIAYAYDSLGRVNSRSIDGVASSVLYDQLGRVSSATNILGSFMYKYINQTSRLASISLPNGQSTIFDYLDNIGDQRLKQIWNKTSGGGTLSKFNYEYDKEGQITKWTQQAGIATPKYYDLGYDLADQLISATLKNNSTNAIVKRFAYQYDKAGNRTSEQVDNSVTSAAYNTLNQMTKQQDGGPMRFKGTLSEFSSVLVKNQTTADSSAAPVDSSTNSFEAFVKVIPGTNNISVKATDYSGNNNTQTNNYNIAVTNGVNNTLVFDNNGNITSATNPAVTYGWDAIDRLVKITQGTNVTEFVYDGLSRRVAEKLNGTIIKRWIWCGTELCEERDAGGGTVTKRFFPQGEQIGTSKYYFSRDHLGSVREMTDGSGLVKARYDYDPYGRRILVAGSDIGDFGFTGHYFHKTGNLYLAMYRAYDANLGRWLSRDLLEENGGINLYRYSGNDPINYLDLLGLDHIINYAGQPVLVKDNPQPGTNPFPDGGKAERLMNAIAGAYLDAYLDLASMVLPEAALSELGIGAKLARWWKSFFKTECPEKAAAIKKWLGDEAKLIRNKDGDLVLVSKDGSRRVQFHMENPSPHNNPHAHVDQKINEKWQKSGQIYPKDVPHN